MKKIVNALRKWCGTECTDKTEGNKNEVDLTNDNRGFVFVAVASLGTIFLIVVCVLGLCAGCVDKFTCGACTKCASCCETCSSCCN